MSQNRRSTRKEEAKETVRMGWLRAMYLANVVVSFPIGLAVLAAPETMHGVLGIPAGDPVHYGIASGAVPLAFGLAGLLGLRYPLRLAPVLGLQLLYKTLFLVGGVLPMALAGTVPGYATPVIVIFVLFAVGDGIAVPFRHLFSGVPGR